MRDTSRAILSAVHINVRQQMNTAWRIAYHLIGICFIGYSAWGVRVGELLARSAVIKRNEDPVGFWAVAGVYAFVGVLLISTWWR